jgi:uncharacterized iron-regulated protein
LIRSARWITAVTLAALLPAMPSAFAAAPAHYPWENRLHGDTIALLGEVHDNQRQQQLRLEILKRAISAGWRPTIAMEQFDREHQADIERARATRPRDADYLIEQAGGSHGQQSGGWNWDYYRPYVALALEYQLPLLAANLSRDDAEKIVRQGYGAVFDAATIRDLDLDPTPAGLQSSQEKEVEEGHCHALPTDLLPRMAQAQMARDAVMAAVLRSQAASGAVLLAGDGHVRRDLGVPRWLGASALPRVLSVGFLERGVTDPPVDAFDAIIVTRAAPRADPCAALRRHSQRAP